MARSTDRHKFELGDAAFYVRRFPAFVGLEILGDLQKRFLGPMMADVSLDSELSQDFVAKKFLNGIASVSGSIDGKTLAALCRQLLDPNCISVEYPDPANGNLITEKLTEIEIARMGLTPADLIFVCVEVVKWNYADFLARFTGGIGAALSRAGKLSAP